MNMLYLTHPLNGIMMIAAAVGTGFVLVRKFKLSWGLWWAGGVTFVLSQVAHIPFNLLFINPILENLNNSPLMRWQILLLSAILLGLSAGAFEEIARYVAYRWWQKDARNWSQSLVFGAGHGGVEAIILGSLVLFTFFQMVALQSTDLNTIVPAEDMDQIQRQLNNYWSATWYVPLLGALERIFTIPFHISASVLVLQAFIRQQTRWVLLAISWHTLINAIVVFAANRWDIFIAEGLLGLLTIISLAIIFFFREPTKDTEEIPEPLGPPKSMDELDSIEVSKETLERTRYN